MPRLYIRIDPARLRRRRQAVLLTNAVEMLLVACLILFIGRSLFL